MKQAFFSPRRFARLARQYAREHGRGWAVAALALGVLLALLAVMALSISSYGHGMQSGSQAGFYYTGLLLSGYLAAHRLHGVWRSREAALVYLMRPAAVFEKWLLAALLALLVWPLIYSAVFAVVYGVAAQVGYGLAVGAYEDMLRHGGNWSRPPDAADYALFVPLRQLKNAPGLVAQGMLALAYAALMGYAAATLTWFGRHAALRALLLLIALGLTTLVLLAGLGNGSRWGHVLFDAWLRPRPLPLWASLLAAAFWLGVPALLWLASWRALREKELA